MRTIEAVLNPGALNKEALVSEALLEESRGRSAAALALAREAAEAGSVEGMVLLGDLLARGGENEAVGAASWFQRAQEAGDVLGTLRWADCVAKGVGGPQDPRLAVRLLEPLAELGEPQACFDLATLAKLGYPGTRGEDASSWLAMADAFGHPNAAGALAALCPERTLPDAVTFTVAGTPLRVFARVGRLLGIQVERSTSVVGPAPYSAVAHKEQRVFELDLGDGGVHRVYPTSHGANPIPGQSYRFMGVGRAATGEGKVVTMLGANGSRFELLSAEDMARGLGIWLPRLGPIVFWSLASILVWAVVRQLPWYMPKGQLSVLPVLVLGWVGVLFWRRRTVLGQLVPKLAGFEKQCREVDRSR